MNPVLKIFWCIYLLAIWLPIALLATILCTSATAIGCKFGSNRIWGYYPGMIWSRIMCVITMTKVTVEGRENIQKGHSYVFCSNHTSIYDIFLIYGYIGVRFKWIMKKELEKVPFIGWACKNAGFLFINRQKGRQAFNTLQDAKTIFTGGVSLVIFPEGTRTRDGQIGKFKRGAFEIAREMELPIIPVRIDGGYDVLPYNRMIPYPGHLKLTILPEISSFNPADHDAEIEQIEEIRQLIIEAGKKQA